MATTTVESTVAPRPRLSRWESPWLNPKLLSGLAMVLAVGLMGIVGSQFWDATLARVASAPLNLPPPWGPGVEVTVEEGAQETAGGAKDAGALTGTNPLKQESQESTTGQTGRDARGFGVPSWEHPLGTESNGRDMLAVLLVGAPRSLRVGLIAAGIGMGVGILLGFTAGFLGGWVDTVIRTIADSVVTIPSLAVLIVISAFVRQISVENMGLLLALFAWPQPTRLIRSQVLSMREQGYVKMAHLSGVPTFDIMFKEMMPNLLPYLAASLTGNVSGAILAATGLEVLGLGPTRIPTLGMTIFYAIRAAAILRGMWWWWGIPIAALIVIFTGLFLMTVGLDEIANPRLRGIQA
ncbi:MAG: putative peptide transport permease protein [Anaerolineales bacterium]|nr:putative peptide transport permease protein [Anaerolineales bacterium]